MPRVGYALAVPIALAAPVDGGVWPTARPLSTAGPILAVHIWSGIFVFIGVARGQWADQ